MQQVALASNRPISQEVQQQVASFVSPVPDPLATAVDALSLPWEDLDAYAFPPTAILGKVVEKLYDSPMQEHHSDCSGVAQHALVLALSGHVQPNPTEPAQSAQSSYTALQSDFSQKSDKSKSPCMAPRASGIKEQSFSEAVAKRIEAPQRQSTKSVYEQSGPFLQSGASAIRWTSVPPPL